MTASIREGSGERRRVELRYWRAYAAWLLVLAFGGGCYAEDPAAAWSSVEAATATLITLPDGPVRGRSVEGTRSFIGIPYAAAPVGALRWKPPQAPIPWSTPLDATGAGVACIQAESDVAQTEDCLRLNVFAPDSLPQRPIPVMVFLHGGGNTRGSANELQQTLGARLFNGAFLRAFAQREVLVVTLNYRLGALGFLAHPALTAEAGSSGNYGLMDQQAALHWIQRNIAAFGGDPSQVTLFGQGAGASDVCYQLLANAASGLVHAAALESGTCGASALPELEEAQARGRVQSNMLGCERDDPSDELACLRALPASAYAADSGHGAEPAHDPLAIVDGAWLRQQPSAALAAGRFERVPVIVGSNSDEGSYFVRGSGSVADRDAYARRLSQMFASERIAVVAEHYPVAGDGAAADVAKRMITDAFFTCPALRFADTVSRYVDVYRYDFQRAPAIDPLAELGATHTAELLWVWNIWPWVSPYAADDTALAQQIGGYWTRLIDGDPNTEGAPHWRRYETDTRPTLTLDLAIETTEHAGDAACQFWNDISAEPAPSTGT